MKIAIVGYGKMGHLLEKTAIGFGHEVVTTIDVFSPDAKVKIADGDTDSMLKAIKESCAEGVIEFTSPASVVKNVKALLTLKLPVVVGSTGWDDKKAEIAEVAASTGGTVMNSSNFSIGVNMFYKIVEEAARLMSGFSEYDVAVWEMHHNQKKDSPSGTALDIAKHIMAADKRKTEIVTDAFHEPPKPEELHVSSTRCGTVPGTHKVFFDCSADTIEITHTARSREGFANGAVHALEKLKSSLDSGTLSAGKLYDMKDLF